MGLGGSTGGAQRVTAAQPTGNCRRKCTSGAPLLDSQPRGAQQGVSVVFKQLVNAFGPCIMPALDQNTRTPLLVQGANLCCDPGGRQT